MTKAVVMSMIAISALCANGIDDAFAAGKASGEIRLAYINQDNAASTDTYATALGGRLKYETGEWNNVKLGLSGHISQKLHFATGEDEKTNLDFLGENGNSFAYVGEAYVDYTANDLSFRIGRQLIDTPLADTDDIRMLPNTFEAAIVTYTGLDKTTLTGGYINRWAGYDSGADISEFKRPSLESHGATLLGITNKSVENLAVQGWIYRIDNLTDVLYADAVYAMDLSKDVKLELSGQWGHFNEKRQADGSLSTIDGDVIGLGFDANFGMFDIGFAYNRSRNDSDKAVINGLGGGPYFTSMEEMTIDGMQDVSAYQLSTNLNMAEGLTLTALYGDFRSSSMDAKITEWDLIMTYEMDEKISADVSYASVNDHNDNFDAGNDAGYDRFLVRMSYKF